MKTIGTAAGVEVIESRVRGQLVVRAPAERLRELEAHEARDLARLLMDAADASENGQIVTHIGSTARETDSFSACGEVGVPLVAVVTATCRRCKASYYGDDGAQA